MATAKAKTVKAPKAEKTATASNASSTAFAVFTTGGKQYKVRVGEILKIEKIIGEHKVGDKLSFDQVLLVDDAGATQVGAPFLAGKKVAAEIVEIGRDKKITVIHYKQKSKYFKKYGHRQPYFKVKVLAIN